MHQSMHTWTSPRINSPEGSIAIFSGHQRILMYNTQWVVKTTYARKGIFDDASGTIDYSPGPFIFKGRMDEILARGCLCHYSLLKTINKCRKCSSFLFFLLVFNRGKLIHLSVMT